LDSKIVKKTRKIYREINRVLNDMIKKTDIIIDAYIDGMTLVALIGMCRA